VQEFAAVEDRGSVQTCAIRYATIYNAASRLRRKAVKSSKLLAGRLLKPKTGFSVCSNAVGSIATIGKDQLGLILSASVAGGA